MGFLYFLESIRNPVLDTFFAIVTEFGGEAIFIGVAIVLFWCLDKKAGYYMLTVGFAGMIVSQFLKIFCRIPDPGSKTPTSPLWNPPEKPLPATPSPADTPRMPSPYWAPPPVGGITRSCGSSASC